MLLCFYFLFVLYFSVSIYLFILYIVRYCCEVILSVQKGDYK